jgi:hypothetical protein
MAPLDLVALTAAGAVHHDLGSLERSFDPFAAGQVTFHELEPLLRLAGPPGEHPDRAPLRQQRRDDMFPRVPVPPVTNIGAVMNSSSGRVFVTSVVCGGSLL